MAGFADLIRSRLRALVPVGLISLFGASIYVFFRSLSPSNNEFGYGEVQHPHYQFKIDGLGRVGVPDSRLEGGLIFNTNEDDLVTPELKAYEPDQLMSLPILHRTSKDPFDTKNGFKPLRPSQSPWSTDTQSGLMLINRLSRNRFPSADSNDPNRGSLPPPLPPWPSPKILKEKQNSLKKPISKDLISGLNTSYVWADRHLIQDGKLPKIQWDGFDKPNWESRSDRIDRLERQGWVRRGFQHVWEGYKARAWGHDELRPISGSFQDPFAGWGATLVDCLDTLLIMNLTLEYNYARTHVKAIDWAHTMEMNRMSRYSSQSSTQPMISFFETVIRYMGGLISAYDLSGDELMLERAEELAEWLVPAFGTSSGSSILSLPNGLKSVWRTYWTKFYYDVVQKITDLLDSDQWISSSRPGTLFPTHLNPQSPRSLSGQYTFGAMADSYYEYLHADACVWAYESTKTGVGPERITIVEGDDQTRWQPVIYEGQNFRELKSDPLPGASIQDGRYLGRPETIESVYYMWRITGDRQWQDRGWRMFTSWMEACATTFGFADLAQVNSWPPQLSDKQESFVLAETFKYYYLLFSEPDLISLDEYVFNTEAHPFRLEQANGSKGSKAEIKRYWNGSDSTLDEKYYPPGILNNQTGFGTFLQQWSRVDLDKISDADRLVYNQVLGLLQH
ncbi:hypothetical protein Pst134EA_031700 [Puccinia striiformis f. sp. tritici]|uniref:uncharacterized protein n=1 Tax=Puccinia striiformis f. sp. tritici TaxID=168172 RepID=UPI002007BC99|nr:uncharacterized protein Pst134EA_031700 [Puccinia striiformis f. sp. tritici]KAH9442654.1 hypothetical protein Pst134EA_031700 [Puccinia striiformis f. sp. tritici]